MTTTLTSEAPVAEEITDEPASPEPPVRPQLIDDGGDWPNTGRVLPWLIAGFVTMLWLVPFDAMKLPFSMPFDAKLDRVLLAGIFVVWVASFASRPEVRPRLRSMGWIDATLLLLLGVAVLSVLVNVTPLALQDEITDTIKKVVLLFAYALFFYIAATVLRPREIAPMLKYIVFLSCVMAVGIVIEYRTGTNHFYDFWRHVPGISVADPPADPQFGRELITGPTSHAIAAANMLAFALPFALLGYVTTKKRFWYGVAICLLLCGAFATIRKTGALAPLAAIIVVFAYRPRLMLKALPLGVIILLLAQFVVAPGSVVRIKAQIVTFNDQKSVEGRREDRPAIQPDLDKKPLLGRGHGSWTIERYRLLDNEYLQREVETGKLGLWAYLALIGAVGLGGHRVARRRGLGRNSLLAVGLVAGAAVFAAVSAFYDVLSFAQAPYMFFLFAAMVVVASHTKPEEGAEPAEEPADPQPAPTPAPSPATA